MTGGADGVDRVVVLPRGINVGGHHKVPMAELRRLMTGAGFTGVRTYVASGNVVCDRAGRSADEVAGAVRALMADHLGVDVACLSRLRDEVDATVSADPLGGFDGVADTPARHSVVFCAEPPDPAAVAAVDAAAHLPERFSVVGRDVHVWYPEGTQQSRLAAVVARLAPGGTARNWRTVLTIQRLLTDP